MGGVQTVGNTSSYQADTQRENVAAVAGLADTLAELGAKWWTVTDQAARNQIAYEALKVGASICSIVGRDVVRGADGVWYLDEVGGKKLFEVIAAQGVEALFKYHTGTMSAGRRPTLKENEILTVLESGEAVLDKGKKDELFIIVDFTTVLSDKLGKPSEPGGIFSFPMSGNSLLPSVAALRDPGAVQNAFTFSPSISVQIVHDGSFDDNDAERYGRMVADSAVGELASAISARGIGGVGEERLRG